jgi:predicted nucleotidyltransferase
MLKDNILDILQEHQKNLQEFGVKSLAIFGSVVRDEARADSDVDILVEFSRPVGLLAFLKLIWYLEKILGEPVDLVTSKGLRPQWRERIIQEAIHAV